MAYGDAYGRGVRGVVLEAFGVGNMPDLKEQGWIPWLRQQTKKGLKVRCSALLGRHSWAHETCLNAVGACEAVWCP